MVRHLANFVGASAELLASSKNSLVLQSLCGAVPDSEQLWNCYWPLVIHQQSQASCLGPKISLARKTDVSSFSLTLGWLQLSVAAGS